MGKPYASEMSRLEETFEWAIRHSHPPFLQLVKNCGGMPLTAIGSGGSLSAAHALAWLHQFHTGQFSRVQTPLQMTFDSTIAESSNWLITASGRNVDILNAFKMLAKREPKVLASICGMPHSKLAALASNYPYTDLIELDFPAGKDGYLATNSLLAFVVLFAKFYTVAFPKNASINTEQLFSNMLNEYKRLLPSWKKEAQKIWKKNITLVLHGPETHVGAFDFESKFTESAIGITQIADYRNFAHGRHHWLTPHKNECGVLAFITPNDEALAEKTLALIPSNVPVARITLPAGQETAMVLSLMAAMQLSGWAGVERGIDPGRPNVAQFGRKLYHLTLPKQQDSIVKGLTENEHAALRRKIKSSTVLFEQSKKTLEYKSLSKFKKSLSEMAIKGIIFDYDGTLVDTRRRFDPPESIICSQIERLIEHDVKIVVATGRGKSVAESLQKGLGKKTSSKIHIAYYNGAEIGSADNKSIPDGVSLPCRGLDEVSKLLKSDPLISSRVEQEDRQFQISLVCKDSSIENLVWDKVQSIILACDNKGIKVGRSGHSIDILGPDVSKISAIRYLSDNGIAPKNILKIGDKGAWPGNDFALLNEAFSLSVDEVNSSLDTCWNLAPPGFRGIYATAYYLEKIKFKKKIGFINLDE